MQTSDAVQGLRKSYETGSLDEATLLPDPIDQFGVWMQDAINAQVDEPNAMTLCTASVEGVPDGRIVLLRGFDARGFAFYTNYESRKGADLAANANAALVFLWHPLERQVRIQGTVARVTPEESDAYFRSRPRGHQVSAWTSPQSKPIASRDELIERTFEGDVPRPEFWGGYRVTPTRMEFWQGRKNRLHDRFVYTPGWTVTRLAP